MKSARVTASAPKIITLTQNFAVPYRPSASRPMRDRRGWFDAKKKGGGCFHGQLFKINFAKLGNAKAPVTLPADAIISVAFNTFTHGYAPTGVEGPYDSLNVALTESLNEGEAVAPSVGTNPVPGQRVLQQHLRWLLLRRRRRWNGHVPHRRRLPRRPAAADRGQVVLRQAARCTGRTRPRRLTRGAPPRRGPSSSSCTLSLQARRA